MPWRIPHARKTLLLNCDELREVVLPRPSIVVVHSSVAIDVIPVVEAVVNFVAEALSHVHDRTSHLRKADEVCD